MRLCVGVDGQELDDDVVVKSGRVRLLLRIETGYKIDPPEGTFSVDPAFAVGSPTARGKFPELVVHARPGVPCRIAFSSDPQPSGNPIELDRTLTFVAPKLAGWMAVAVAAAGLLTLFALWQFGVAFENGRSEVKSVWSADTLFTWGLSAAGILAAVVGLSWDRARNYLIAHTWFTIRVAAVVAVLALVLPVAFLGVVTNATPETISPFQDPTTQLAPATTTRYLRGVTALNIRLPFAPCSPGRDCRGTDLSFNSLLLSALGWKKTVIRCAPRPGEAYFANDLAESKTCKPDPDLVIARSPRTLDFVKPAGNVSADERIRYELTPFASGVEQKPEGLAAETVSVKLEDTDVSAYSELVLEGHDLLARVHFPLPANELRAYGPWTTRGTLLGGRVLSGPTVVGTLSCSVRPKTAQLRVNFLRARAHVKRIAMAHLGKGDTENGEFHESFEIARPELVTHVPWCLDSASDKGAFALELYVDGSWTPNGWSMELPVNIAAVHVYGEDGALKGRLVAAKDVPMRGTLVSYSIGADVGVWATAKYQWESETTTSRYHTAVWAMAGDETFNVQLFDGSRREARKIAGRREFTLSPLRLRQCYIDKRTNHEIPKPKDPNACDHRDTADWFRKYPHVDCSLTSSLCTVR